MIDFNKFFNDSIIEINNFLTVKNIFHGIYTKTYRIIGQNEIKVKYKNYKDVLIFYCKAENNKIKISKI